MKFDELLAIAVVAGALFWPQIRERLPVNPQPPVGPAVVVPDADAQRIVAPVVAAAKGNPNALRYAAYWSDMADLVRLKPNAFKTTADFKKLHGDATTLFIDLEGGQAGGMKASTEAAIFEFFGNDQAQLNAATATRCFNALSWACSQ